MNDAELLMQRFVDNELRAEERIQFLRMLDHDKALRRRLLDIEGLIADAGHLPELALPAGFTAQVFHRLPVAHPRLVQRVCDRLTAPHVLRWNLVGVMAVACALAVLAWALGQSPIDLLRRLFG